MLWFEDVTGRRRQEAGEGEHRFGLITGMTMHSLPRLIRPCRGNREVCFANRPALSMRTGYLPVPLSLILVWFVMSCRKTVRTDEHPLPCQALATIAYDKQQTKVELQR